jgi:hypothetical protein
MGDPLDVRGRVFNENLEGRGEGLPPGSLVFTGTDHRREEESCNAEESG